MKMRGSDRWETVIDFIKAHDDYLVTSHYAPDGDAVGSVLAMGRILELLGKRSTLAIEGGVPEKYHFLPGSSNILNPLYVDIGNRFSTAVALDVGSYNRIGKVSELLTDSPKILNIDHHATNDGFGEVSIVDSEASSVSEILFRMVNYAGIPLDPVLSTTLYTGIMTDTGRFRFSNTTSEVFQICAELITAGADPERITEQVYYNLPRVYMEALCKSLGSLRFYRRGSIAVMEYLEPEEIEDTEGFIDFATSVKDVEAAVFIRAMKDGRFKVSLRSKNYLDVRRIAENYGGGGHTHAAGFRFRGGFDELKHGLLKILDERLSEG